VYRRVRGLRAPRKTVFRWNKAILTFRSEVRNVLHSWLFSFAIFCIIIATKLAKLDRWMRQRVERRVQISSQSEWNRATGTGWPVWGGM
jgi:hypothetical protein